MLNRQALAWPVSSFVSLVSYLQVICPLLSTTVDSCAQVDDSENPLQFSQVFHLIPDAGSYYVSVHIQQLTRETADSNFI